MDLIMLIDNSPATNALMSIILKNNGYSVINVRNGHEGINAANEILQRGGKISVCIADINLPVMDGVDFLKEFRKINTSTPVIVMSSEFSENKIAECAELGASWWVAKPFNPPVLISAIKNLLIPETRKENGSGDFHAIQRHMKVNELIHRNMWRLQ